MIHMFTLSQLVLGYHCVQTTGYIDVCLKGMTQIILAMCKLVYHLFSLSGIVPLVILMYVSGCCGEKPDYSGYMRSQDIPAVQLKGVNYSIVMD